MTLEVGKGQQNLYECANLNRGYLVTMQSIKGLVKTLTNANISSFLQRQKLRPTVSFNFKAKLLGNVMLKAVSVHTTAMHNRRVTGWRCVNKHGSNLSFIFPSHHKTGIKSNWYAWVKFRGACHHAKFQR